MSCSYCGCENPGKCGPEGINRFADELIEDLQEVGFTITKEVAISAAKAHIGHSKDAAMGVLICAGVPMVMKPSIGAESLSTRIPTKTYSVNGKAIFIGW